MGTVQLGLPYGVANQSGQPDHESSNRILSAAVEGGITSFDTAPSYGSSEEVLGRFFTDQTKPLIISKWSLSSEDIETARRQSLREQLEASLKGTAAKLGVSKVPAMLLHSPLILKEYGDEVTGLLREFVQDGKVGYVGVSLGVHVGREFEQLWPFLEDDLYHIVQLPLNVLDQRLIRNGALEKLRRSSKKVLARSAYLQGLIFLNKDSLPDYVKGAVPWLNKLHRLAERENMTVSEFAFSYVRDTPGVTSVLVGAETAEQVRENLNMLQVKAISEETREQIAIEFADVPDQVITPALWNLWKKS
ncbi:aldo/keto reductase [Paenibacillus silviterrae]|uniref:aldo/keto reductase n=1 Tax=Paenibacillus silviterrae TaxID=3242194 RepID=UPI002542B974|nr:aldo/keto reductase [Paenibacillus chinjuensis]